MSYDVYAYGPPDATGHSPELFDAPLGSGTALSHHWAAPARELGLPFLSRVAGDELLIAHNDLLDLIAELQRLEAHWTETIPTIPGLTTSSTAAAFRCHTSSTCYIARNSSERPFASRKSPEATCTSSEYADAKQSPAALRCVISARDWSGQWEPDDEGRTAGR
ncbi:hypothetical protein ACQP2K_32510 [Microbispora siamensis]